MACEIVVQVKVSGDVGTDDEFELRKRLEQELLAELSHTRAPNKERVAEFGRSEPDRGRINVILEAVTDPAAAFGIVKGVLKRLQLLDRHGTSVTTQTWSDADPDDVTAKILWPLPATPATTTG
jgi:hypothetical protein